MRREREAIAQRYRAALQDVAELELPVDPAQRVHAWHLFPIRLRLEKLALAVDRNVFLDALRDHGVGCSVHWRPLHLHPYYEETFHWRPDQLPIATLQWTRLISLPIFPGLQEDEQDYVIAVVRELCARYAETEPRSGTAVRKPR
jgi:perosamine synthetase